MHSIKDVNHLEKYSRWVSGIEPEIYCLATVWSTYNKAKKVVARLPNWTLQYCGLFLKCGTTVTKTVKVIIKVNIILTIKHQNLTVKKTH